MALSREIFLTSIDQTSKWFFPCMTSYMSLEIAFFPEGFEAALFRALEWFIVALVIVIKSNQILHVSMNGPSIFIMWRKTCYIQELDKQIASHHHVYSYESSGANTKNMPSHIPRLDIKTSDNFPKIQPIKFNKLITWVK
jgi:hypothetical protein